MDIGCCVGGSGREGRVYGGGRNEAGVLQWRRWGEGEMRREYLGGGDGGREKRLGRTRGEKM